MGNKQNPFPKQKRKINKFDSLHEMTVVKIDDDDEREKR